MAPEVLRGEFSDKSDVWSIGVIMYMLLCGRVPFEGDNEAEVGERICEGSPPF